MKGSPHLTDEGMATILAACKDLVSIDVSFCSRVTHATLQRITMRCPGITVVVCAYPQALRMVKTQLTDESVQAFLAVATQLRILNISYLA